MTVVQALQNNVVQNLSQLDKNVMIVKSDIYF